MALTPAQQVTLKAAIIADPILDAEPNNSDGAFAIAAALNVEAVPAYIVWRTAIDESEITAKVSDEATSWSWTSYIARSDGERDAWGRMFSISGTIDASLPNVRQAMADIFSGGASGAAGQRAHLLACGKRNATRAEKIFATGAGTQGSPSTMEFEGALAYQDVQAARNLP